MEWWWVIVRPADLLLLLCKSLFAKLFIAWREFGEALELTS